MSGGIVTLPWPPSSLSPNARLHWRALDRAKKAYKLHCDETLMVQRRPRAPYGRIPIVITLSPPDRRKRDRDNMQSSLKYALDRLAARMCVDDNMFDPSYRFTDPTPPHGAVIVEIAND